MVDGPMMAGTFPGMAMGSAPGGMQPVPAPSGPLQSVDRIRNPPIRMGPVALKDMKNRLQLYGNEGMRPHYHGFIMASAEVNSVGTATTGSSSPVPLQLPDRIRNLTLTVTSVMEHRRKRRQSTYEDT
ncbi:hypothetical protein DPMN_120515 [Dreissena polymorpha]|uniref:Uncharacterized protein n=1 Tax=Dreissena polymorpha TaxID=45954 RepID=A0A9D4GNP6_DREPO|nr:hypothetical protein DPMN_120515 [Dreissena polymorpha]